MSLHVWNLWIMINDISHYPNENDLEITLIIQVQVPGEGLGE